MMITLTIKELIGCAALIGWAVLVGVFQPQSAFFLLLVYALVAVAMLWSKSL